ncbi:hypothetical protein N7471_007479 [Penicillium samsonianum]|uniref:uncharacterized protein n=1 Tax=Penicillium samsonianum TaxID=1882272 RepID=UPI002549095E|nr:uncharacterized protein N7471_007479 [Penicillium samsonianum]KAJ6132264.1 hypothetical protein N7471_007479 [Penicillium samsonianum]
MNRQAENPRNFESKWKKRKSEQRREEEREEKTNASAEQKAIKTKNTILMQIKENFMIMIP